ERAETRTGHRKPENKVVDMRQVVDVLPMFEVGSTGRTWHGKHVKEHKAPDEGNLPEGSTETLEPADDISGQAGGLRSATSMETDLSYTRRSGKQQKMTHLGLGSERALRCWKRTYQGRFACETPPDEAREMGVLSTPRTGWGDNADDESLIRLRIPVVEVMMQLAGTLRTCIASRKRC
ncbi:hypothetical protein F5141DRAFT_1108900, partial [Pisolithus sp. B1]